MKFLTLVVLLLAGVGGGCQTHQGVHGLRSAASTALAEHRFAPPTLVHCPGGEVWAVASRPESDVAVQTVSIRVSSDGRAGVEITKYQYVGSNWAVVGHLFDQGRSQREAQEMQREISNRLLAP